MKKCIIERVELITLSLAEKYEILLEDKEKIEKSWENLTRKRLGLFIGKEKIESIDFLGVNDAKDILVLMLLYKVSTKLKD